MTDKKPYVDMYYDYATHLTEEEMDRHRENPQNLCYQSMSIDISVLVADDMMLTMDAWFVPQMHRKPVELYYKPRRMNRIFFAPMHLTYAQAIMHVIHHIPDKNIRIEAIQDYIGRMCPK